MESRSGYMYVAIRTDFRFNKKLVDICRSDEFSDLGVISKRDYSLQELNVFNEITVDLDYGDTDEHIQVTNNCLEEKSYERWSKEMKKNFEDALFECVYMTIVLESSDD